MTHTITDEQRQALEAAGLEWLTGHFKPDGSFYPQGFKPAGTVDEKIARLEAERAKLAEALTAQRAGDDTVEALRYKLQAQQAGTTTAQIDAIVAERIGRQLEDAKATAAKLEADLKARDEQIATLGGDLNGMRLRAELDKAIAASEHPIHGSAREDVIAAAERRFVIGDDGQPQARDESGALIAGETPASWLTSQVEQRAHWFKAPSANGGGAAGGKIPAGAPRFKSEDLTDLSAWKAAEKAAADAGVKLEDVMD